MKTILIATLSLISLFTLASDGYEVGDIAIDFNLRNTDGQNVSLADYPDANGFIVIFTCNHCPYSVAYEDRIIAINSKFEPQGYPVIAINPNDAKKFPSDSYEGMQARAAEKQFNFPYLHDETQEIAKTYGAKRTPHVYLLNKEDNGSLVVSYIGAIDDKPYSPEKVQEKFLEMAIESLQNGTNPDPNFVKAVGCSIKWK